MIDFPSQVELAARLLLAAFLGGLIGLERDLSGQPAGLRTHIALALGAALFGVLSGYGFQAFDASRAITNFQVDPTRVASNVVVGVGFLGGGTILKEGARVRGLTTAASLWVTAAIGLGCALGMYGPTLVTTALVLASLVGLRAPRRWLSRRLAVVRETAIVRLESGADPSEVVAALNQLRGVRISSLTVREREDGAVVRADLSGRGSEPLEDVLAPLSERDDVSGLEVV
ncbi:MAG: MgtC/SapB family protein [Actinomycetota bacterium]|nr:MgtC/SapB family protein [Actinomycetota bacterium]